MLENIDVVLICSKLFQVVPSVPSFSIVNYREKKKRVLYKLYSIENK